VSHTSCTISTTTVGCRVWYGVCERELSATSDGHVAVLYGRACQSLYHATVANDPDEVCRCSIFVERRLQPTCCAHCESKSDVDSKPACSLLITHPIQVTLAVGLTASAVMPYCKSHLYSLAASFRGEEKTDP
jgi:hypothetical protein